MSKKSTIILLASVAVVATATTIAALVYKKKPNYIYCQLANKKNPDYISDKDSTLSAIKAAGEDKDDIDD